MRSSTKEDVVEIDLSELLCPPVAPAAPPIPAETEAETPLPVQVESDRLTPLQIRINALTDQLRPPVGKKIHHILAELSRLLKYLNVIEDKLSGDGSPQTTITVFRVVSGRASALLDFINASTVGAGDGGLREALAGAGFALRHELHRVYQDEAAGLDRPGDTRLSRGQLIRAHGLLQNCFQQLTITLLRVLEPTLSGETVFEDQKIKREQSIKLFAELTSLLTKVRKAQNGSGVLQSIPLINTLSQFRQETLRFLLYQDRAGFESFIAEIIETHDDAASFIPVLRRFTSYLETLIAQVGMRTVLKD